AIQLAPGVGHYWWVRSQIRLKKDGYEQARADLTEGIRVASEAEKAAMYGARAYFETSYSKIEPAIADFTEAIRLRGTKLTAGDAGLYFTRANLYLAHAETDRALADYDQAIRLNPKPAWHYHNRGLAHARKEQWDRAIADFAKAKELAGADKH